MLFNLKLWRPIISPTEWDGLYWQIDSAIYPLVKGCMALREALFPIIPADSNFYMTAFISMFYISFCSIAYWMRSAFVFISIFTSNLAL